MSGHVFIVHGDLTRLACDGWLMPCDHERNVNRHWYEPITGHEWRPTTPELNWLEDRTRVERVENWPAATPQPWLVNTGGFEGTDIDWYVEGVAEFIRVAAAAVAGRRFLKQRVRPLLAIPLVGAGDGGGAARAGEIVGKLLPCLRDGVDCENVDIALVLKEEPAYAAAVRARNRLANAGPDPWRELSEPLKRQAEDLARQAKAGRLVLFVGAGLSQAANAPSWRQLLEDLARRVGILDDDEDREKHFRQLPLLDQARLVELAIERSCRKHAQGADFEPSPQSIGLEVREILREHWCVGIGHALLAALPVTEIVTTNYDTLFEDAAEGGGRPVAVLPYHRVSQSGRWLLKMHGCVNHPDDIVLTRGDFLRYDDQRAALRGIVQAMLITKHMLFVGFSLSDDNFYRIAEEVRKAVDVEGRPAMAKFGTALTVDDNPLFRELWSRDLEWVTFGRGTACVEGETLAEAARRQEIFLDYLASRSGPGSRHLLDARFEDVLCDAERELRDAVLGFLQKLTGRARETDAWREIERTFERLGLRPG